MKDSFAKIYCPACGGSMSKVMLDATDFYIDMCIDGCGGMFLDSQELNYLVSHKDALNEVIANIKLSRSLHLLEDKAFEKVDDMDIRVCPKCNLPMSKEKIDGSGVIIDVCDRCGAKFLDLDELEKFSV